MRPFLFFLLLCVTSALGQEVRRAILVRQAISSEPLEGSATMLPNTKPSSQWQATADWIAHDPAIQAAWNQFRQQRYEPMQQWALNELSTRIPRPRVVRYFFGGPDLLSVMVFFSETPTYILCGMEPVGKIKSIEELSPEELKLGAAQIGEATRTFLLYGYFITKEMKNQMNGGPFQGVLPILLTFLALNDDQILSVETLPLGGAPGVKISFQARSGGPEQELFYAQANLSNEGSHSFFKWLHSFGPGAAYLKAASYLLHEHEFSRAREFLLAESTTILQDDSGIPLRFFDQEKWGLYFFGSYQSPIELFKKYDQPDLATAYSVSGLRGPMSFGTGYQFHSGESGGANLLLAVRKGFVPRATVVK
ncbi:MAG: hypothetical protein ACOYK6_00770 [Chthoniobacterales bacterium]